jgi:acid phosphatase
VSAAAATHRVGSVGRPSHMQLRRSTALTVAGLLAALVVVIAVFMVRPSGSSPVAEASPSSPPSLIAGQASESASASLQAASPSVSPAPSPTPTAGASASAMPPASAPANAGNWPAVGHIYEIVFENHEFGSIIGSSSAPYINSLASEYALATGYTAVDHPSLPNYLALWSGSTQGVTDDAKHTFSSGQTLGDQIEASGRSWHVAAQNVPVDTCFTGSSSSGGEDGPGKYVRKHEPAISWTTVSQNAERCALITDFTHFDPAVGNFWFIVPNLCNDMHDCPVATGDAWLRGFLPKIINSAAYKADGLIVLTFDEGSGSAGGGGRIATILISPKARTQYESSVAHDHYSLLRTIEDLWGMPCLANSCSATPMREFFP